MLLGEYLEQRNIAEEDLASILSELGILSGAGKPITAGSIRGMKARTVPKAWTKALGLEPASEAEESEAAPGASGGQGRREQAPKRPAEAAIAVVEAGAAKRIAGAYKFAGAALAAGSGSQGVAVVWGDQADNIASLWLEAAQENPWAARFVNLMQSGGTTGDLAAAHLYLAGATLYVLGAGIPGGDALFAKYSRHRPAARPEPEPAGPPAGANGNAAAEGEPFADSPAESPVGNGTG